MSEGIVLELQRDALNEDIPIEALLRKAYLIAKKLKLEKFEQWVSQEQNGYKEPAPDYRQVPAEITAWNPLYGWVPVILPADEKMKLTPIRLSSPISTLWASYCLTKKAGVLYLAVAPKLEEIFNQNKYQFSTRYSYAIATVNIYKIFSIVRNHILEWALLLEQNGIIGENMSFSLDEKEKAVENSAVNNYTNNFYGDVKQADIQQGKN